MRTAWTADGVSKVIFALVNAAFLNTGKNFGTLLGTSKSVAEDQRARPGPVVEVRMKTKGRLIQFSCKLPTVLWLNSNVTVEFSQKLSILEVGFELGHGG